MDFSVFSKEKPNRCRKKVIPWHVQKRYLESLSQLSLNQTISTGIYKKQIKSLQRNNKHLALTLERNRCLATDKENLQIDNGRMLDIIHFSRLKLSNMAINMKQAAECLNETLALLNSSINDSLSKVSPKNKAYRDDFKIKLQNVEIEPIFEMTESASENSDNLNKSAEFCTKKGKISRVEGCTFSANKKCKLVKKEEKVKRNSRDVPKTAKASSTPKSKTVSKNMIVRNSKKSGPAPNIKSSNKKKSLPKSSNVESTYSLLPTKSSNLFHQTENKQETDDKKNKSVKVILTDIQKAFFTLETKNDLPPKKTGHTSTDSTNFKHFVQNSPEDNILIKKCFSTDKDAQVPNRSLSISDSSNFSNKNVSLDDFSEYKEKLPELSTIKKEVSVCELPSSVLEMLPIGGNKIAKQNDRKSIKNIDSERDKKTHKFQSSKLTKRVQFYFDEDSIENVEGETVESQNGLHKSISKGKARKTVSNKKKPLKNTTLKSNCLLLDNVSKLGKNSFLVTAEVHSPQNGIHEPEIKSNVCISETMEPRVILTDVFKSNRNLLNEMVGNGLHENGCMPKTVTKSGEVPLATFPVKDLNDTHMDFENNAVDEDRFQKDKSIVNKVICQERSKESNICKKQPTVVLRDIINHRKVFDKCHKVYSNEKNRKTYMSYLLQDKENRWLPEDKEIEIIQYKQPRRRSKIVSYKEPSLNAKMRRLF